MPTMMAIYRISIAQDSDREAFEAHVEAEVFPKVLVDHQTRGGIVREQALWRSDTSGPEPEYAWVVRWEDQGGGSPFGSAGAPSDPAPLLAEFGATAHLTRYTLALEGGAADDT
jgi:hypothetical protein